MLVVTNLVESSIDGRRITGPGNRITEPRTVRGDMVGMMNWNVIIRRESNVTVLIVLIDECASLGIKVKIQEWSAVGVVPNGRRVGKTMRIEGHCWLSEEEDRSQGPRKG